MSQSRQPVFCYKQIRLNPGTLSLQKLLEEANQICPLVKDRIQTLTEEATICRAVNVLKEQYGMMFGEMIMYEEGKTPRVLKMETEQASLPIEELSLESESTAIKRELLESVLYFGVLDNHAVIVQSSALSTRLLEYHLGWLLSEKSRVAPVNFEIVLADQVSEVVRQQIQERRAKSVKIGAPVRSEIQEATPTIDSQQQIQRVTIADRTNGFNLIRQYLPRIFEDLTLENSLDEANLRVKLEVTYSRKTNDIGQKIMDDLAVATRHLDDEDIEIRFKDGSSLKGDTIKIRERKRIPALKGMMISDDLFQEMAKWLRQKIENGTIRS